MTASALTEYYKVKDKILPLLQQLTNLQDKECLTEYNVYTCWVRTPDKTVQYGFRVSNCQQKWEIVVGGKTLIRIHVFLPPPVWA